METLKSLNVKFSAKARVMGSLMLPLQMLTSEAWDISCNSAQQASKIWSELHYIEFWAFSQKKKKSSTIFGKASTPFWKKSVQLKQLFDTKL